MSLSVKIAVSLTLTAVVVALFQAPLNKKLRPLSQQSAAAPKGVAPTATEKQRADDDKSDDANVIDDDDAKISASTALTPAQKIAKQKAHLACLKQQDIELVRGLCGQLKRVSMPLSPRLKRRITAWIYLPPGYDKSSTRFPVVYILHGAPGGVRDCFVNARVHRAAEELITSGQIKPLILVGWDGAGPNGVADTVNYLNRADGSWPMEDFITRELVPWVDRTFRTQPRPQSRALLGFSAGGYGAANLGLKHPDIWRVLASHSGFFDPADDMENMPRLLGAPTTETPSGAKLNTSWQQNSPIWRVRQIPSGTRLHFYMDVGQNDSLLPEFQKMRDELQARKIDHEAHIWPGGHTWSYLAAQYFDSLRFIDARFNEMQNSN